MCSIQISSSIFCKYLEKIVICPSEKTIFRSNILWFLLFFQLFSMTNDPTLKEDSFTLVTSQRRNRKKHKNKRLEPPKPSESTEECVVDEDLIIKWVWALILCGISFGHRLFQVMKCISFIEYFHFWLFSDDFTKFKLIYDCRITTKTLLANWNRSSNHFKAKKSAWFALESDDSASV